MAEIISIAEAEALALQRAKDVLAAEDVIGLPTETVYGLAGDATSGRAVARIFEVKGRPRFNPLICHVSGIPMAERYVTFDPLSRRLAELFWPGPLTLVLPLRPGSGIAALTTAGLQTLAVRMPTGFAARLIQGFDRPLAAPSANRSGRISPTRADHVEADVGDRIPLILDGGACAVGLESTIVKAGEDGLTLLRPGGLAAEVIEAELGEPLRRREGPGTIEAPGMMASHYAPDAAVRLNARNIEANEAFINFGGQQVAGLEQARTVIDLSETGDLTEAAASLFDTLKRADASRPPRIAVAPIPATGLGEAINDRLARAAAPRG